MSAEQIEKVKEDLAAFVKQVDQKLAQYSWINQVEAKTNVPKVYLVSAVGLYATHAIKNSSFSVLFTAFLTGFGAHCFVNLVGFVYPVYASFKAIKSHGKDDDTMWLTYWVIFGFFTVFESILDVAFGWVPLYLLLKASFLVYCFLPQTRGATMVFNLMINPLLSEYEDKIDQGISRLSNSLKGEGSKKAD